MLLINAFVDFSLFFPVRSIPISSACIFIELWSEKSLNKSEFGKKHGALLYFKKRLGRMDRSETLKEGLWKTNFSFCWNKSIKYIIKSFNKMLPWWNRRDKK